MRIFIAADIEGCTGIVHFDQLDEGQPRYREARALMTGDINAAIEGALSVCPEATFIVGDGHAQMRNVILEQLHDAAELVIGSAQPENKPLCQCEGVEADHDLVFLVGFHSRAGSRPGLLAHTLVGSRIFRITVNGVELGEAGIAEAICSSYGAPVGLVVGNSELESEVRDCLQPGFEFVSTKRTLGSTAAVCKTPGITRRLIADAAANAVRACQAGALSIPTMPDTVIMRAEFLNPEHARLAAESSSIQLVDTRSIEASASTAADCFRDLWSAICRSLLETPAFLR
ncbi:MAG: M55 family metallopeptidase [Pseudomonadota bacterium]